MSYTVPYIHIHMYLLSADSSDIIAKDLVAANLVEGKNLVVGEWPVVTCTYSRCLSLK